MLQKSVLGNVERLNLIWAAAEMAKQSEKGIADVQTHYVGFAVH